MNRTRNLIFRTISFLFNKTPQIIVYNTLLSIIGAVFPYVNIILYSALIDRLVDFNFKVLLHYAGLLVVFDFVFLIISSILQKKVSVETERFLTFQTNTLSEHAASISYEKFCSKEYQNKRRELDELSEETGVNLASVVDIIKRFVLCFGSLVMASITIMEGVVETFFAGSAILQVTLIGIGILNVVMIGLSILSACRIQKDKDFVEEQILPHYKINWYLDREYLRFKKTAKEVRLFNLKTKVMSLLLDADNKINILKQGHEKKATKERILADVAKDLSNMINTVFWGSITILGQLTIGGFTKLLQTSRSVFDNAIGFSMVFVDCRRVGKWLKAFWEYYDIEQGNSDTQLDNSDNGTNDLIVFSDVSFKYSDASSFSINNLNLTIKKGEHIAIVGQNGSGKSTLIMLLCGLHTPREGQVEIFGVAPSAKNFSSVFQDFSLYALPIDENISVSCQPDNCKVNNSMVLAGLPERLIGNQKLYLYKQLDPNGIEVSGGERQKIAIARAFYKDAEIIIMDEPTASLDPISEAAIYEKMHSCLSDKTVIFISHRLSSCKFCDRVVVMEDGKIIQQGTHEVLNKDKNGKYSKLWTAQAQYYQL